MSKLPKKKGLTALGATLLVSSLALVSEGAGAPKSVTLPKSRHPLLTTPNDLKKLFDDGAALLAKDDDGNGPGLEDDVSFSVTFSLPNATSATFPDQSAPNFPLAERYDYRQAKYNDIANDIVGKQLLAATFAKVKHVKKGHDFDGWANPQNRSMILTQEAIVSTSVHEWGHTCGLQHRNSSVVNIMYEISVPDRREINTTERTTMESC